MNTGKTSLALAILLLVMITIMPFQTAGTLKSSNNAPFSDKELVYDLRAGYADELHFLVIENETEQVEAFQAGDTDLLGQLFLIPEEELLGDLLEDPGIEMNTTNRLGIGLLNFNCARYPANCTELRQAFAFALDKRAIQEKVWDNNSIPLDSPVLPLHGDWSLENQPWAEENNYHGADSEKGNQILDAHGWNDTDGDGWREDPAGNPVEIEFLLTFSPMMYQVAVMANESFASIGIKVVFKYDIWTFFDRLVQGDYMIAGHAWDALSLGRRSGPAILRNLQTDDPVNWGNWSNATYDALVDTALTSFNFTEAKQACLDAQKILWHEQPIVTVYQNLMLSYYRTDRWDGWVNENWGYNFEGRGTGGTCGDWSFLKVHLKPEFGQEAGEQYTNWQQGGHLNVSIPGPVDTMNPLLILKLHPDSHATLILSLVYDTLCRRNPYTREFCPWLAKDWKLEELNDANPDSAVDHPRARPGDRLKITYYLHGDLSFHDGYPLTAEDVVYSFELVNYSRSLEGYDSLIHISRSIESVTHVEAVNETTVEFYCRTASSLNLDEINSIPVLPRHIWVNVEDPLTWDNPCPIGSGPYRWKDRLTDDHIILRRNDDFIFNPRNYEWPPDQDGSGTTTTTTATTTSGTGTGPSTTPVPGFVLVTVLITAATAVLARKKRTRR